MVERCRFLRLREVRSTATRGGGGGIPKEGPNVLNGLYGKITDRNVSYLSIELLITSDENIIMSAEFDLASHNIS